MNFSKIIIPYLFIVVSCYDNLERWNELVKKEYFRSKEFYLLHTITKLKSLYDDIKKTKSDHNTSVEERNFANKFYRETSLGSMIFKFNEISELIKFYLRNKNQNSVSNK